MFISMIQITLIHKWIPHSLYNHIDPNGSNWTKVVIVCENITPPLDRDVLFLWSKSYSTQKNTPLHVQRFPFFLRGQRLPLMRQGMKEGVWKDNSPPTKQGQKRRMHSLSLFSVSFIFIICFLNELKMYPHICTNICICLNYFNGQ